LLNIKFSDFYGKYQEFFIFFLVLHDLCNLKDSQNIKMKTELLEDKKHIYQSMLAQNVQISYTGAFDGQVLSVIAKNIEYSLSENPRVNKKMFKIFIELAQNISFYSHEQQKASDGSISGIGTLTIQEFDDYFTFATGNITDKIKIQPVIDKCNAINALDRESLRDYKRIQRKQAPSEKGGGNIGLIQVALTAENPLEYRLIPIDETLAFYIVAVKINKE